MSHFPRRQRALRNQAGPNAISRACSPAAFLVQLVKDMAFAHSKSDVPSRQVSLPQWVLGVCNILDGGDDSDTANYVLTCVLKKVIVRSQASSAASASYRGVVSLWNPWLTPG